MPVTVTRTELAKSGMTMRGLSVLGTPVASEPHGSRKPPARRMGAAGSAAWHAILDGAEIILRDEGYAALNAKRIAERIGVKRQLVYYYFRDLDDLILQLFHRIADRALDQLKAALSSDNALRATWQMGIETFDQTLIMEFMALANRSEQVRLAMLSYAETARNLQVEALERTLDGKPLPRVEVPLKALAVIATWLSLGIQREAALGIENGHREVSSLIHQFLEQCGA